MRPGNRTHFFLALVYLGLLNVVVQIGKGDTPMVYWGLAVSIAAAFLCNIRGILAWSALGVAFLPFAIFLKKVVFPDCGIALEHYQIEILRAANYLGLLSFLVFSFFLFNRKLTQTLAKLDERKVELEGLLRMISHDLTNPSSVIRMRSQALQATLSKVEQFGPEHVALVKDHCDKNLVMLDRIDSLIRDVRDYATASLGAPLSRVKPVNLLAVLDETKELVEKTFSSKGIKFEVINHAQKPPIVGFEKERLVLQVFTNLLSNAAKFSLRGAIVAVTIEEKAKGFQVRITDHGIGMPPEVLEKLFVPGLISSQLGTQGEAGTGFGLMIVKATLEQYEAEIAVESRMNDAQSSPSGTTVTLTFPVFKN